MSSEDLYQGIHEYASYAGDIREGCDAVVVGSGPTGAIMAHNLAEAGMDVILIEAGPIRRPAEYTLDGGKSLAECAWEGGVRGMMGRSVLPTIQGRLLGGSSVINSAMCLRTPQFCFDDWRESWGVTSISRETLDPHYDRIEQFLGICRTEGPALGRRNELFKLGCDNLGISSEATPRNAVGCDGCAECFTGCPTRAKRSMDISYIPAAVKKGLRVYTSIEVDKIVHRGGVATGITGMTVHPHPARKGHSFNVQIDAKVVILAAGCVATPVLLQRSDAPDPYKLIGKDLQAHPGAAIHGVFEEVVNPWHGATQGYQSLEYVEKGFKMEVLWSPPPIMAVRFPGYGMALKKNFATFKYGAMWDAIFSLKHSRGTVSARRGKSRLPNIKYNIAQVDMPLVRDGVIKLMEMFFAAGAHTLLPGIHGMPVEVNDHTAIERLRHTELKPGDLVLATTHLFSTTRMGPDPASSVVNERGEMHQLKNCYICDTGVMPRSPAVNPMLTAMAISDLFSGHLIERFGKTR